MSINALRRRLQDREIELQFIVELVPGTEV